MATIIPACPDCGFHGFQVSQTEAECPRCDERYPMEVDG